MSSTLYQASHSTGLTEGLSAIPQSLLLILRLEPLVLLPERGALDTGQTFKDTTSTKEY